MTIDGLRVYPASNEIIDLQVRLKEAQKASLQEERKSPYEFNERKFLSAKLDEVHFENELQKAIARIH